MAIPLRALILEDQTSDAELIVAELERAGFDVTWQRVESEAAYLAALDATPDVILADYSLPQYDAVRALDVLNAQGREIPFIVVTGSIGEERAVDMIKRGAADYLLKDRLARLGVAVTKAQEQKRLRLEKRQADQLVEQSEKRFRALVDKSRDAIALASRDGTILYASPGAAAIVGVTPERMIGRSAFDGVHPDDQERARRVYALVQRKPGASVTGQFRLRRRDGSWRWVEGTGTNLLHEPGVQAMLANYRDITSFKQAEEEQRRHATQMSVLYESAVKIQQEIEPGQAIRAACDELQRLGAFASVYMVTADGQRLEHVHTSMEDAARREFAAAFGDAQPRFEVPFSAIGALWQRLLAGEAVNASGEADQWLAALPSDMRPFGQWVFARLQRWTLLLAPLTRAGQTTGVIAVLGEQLDSSDMPPVALFARHVSVALEKASLFSETHRRAEQLSLLYDAGLTINRMRDSNRQLEFLFETAMHALGADHAQFLRHDPNRRELRLESAVGYDEGLRARLSELRFEIEGTRGIAVDVARDRKPMIVPEVSADPHWVNFDPTVRSGLWAPVEYEKRLVGVLNVLSTRPHAFSQGDAQLLMLFANQAAVAIENARLFQEAYVRNQELEALAQVSFALRRATSRVEVAAVILDQLMQVAQADGAALAMGDSVPGKILFDLGRGAWEKWTGIALGADQGISGLVFQTSLPYLNPDVLADKRLAHPELVGDVRSVACIPLVVQTRAIGVLWLGRKRPIDEREITFFASIADIAASAIHRITTYEQTERRLRQTQALYAIDMTISSSLDLKSTLNVVLDEVRSQLRVDAAVILLLDPATKMLEYAAGEGFRSKAVEGIRVHLGAEGAGRVALERRMIEIPNLADDPHPWLRPLLLAGEEFVAYFGAPLIAKGQVKGVLEIFHRSPLSPEPEWTEFLRALALQAAIAVDNTQLFDRLQRSNAELFLAYDSTLEGWSRALDLRDEETEGHTRRVTEMTVALAKTMGLRDVDLVHVRRGALLHDIGKIGIPDSILLKPGSLTDQEWIVMRRHPELAYQLLAPIAYLRPALDIPYYHHEKWDGTGYPRGLKGEQIPLAARIFAIVDVWDALRSDRPYRKAWSEKQARQYLCECSGAHFDPQVVGEFFRLVTDNTANGRFQPSIEAGTRAP